MELKFQCPRCPAGIRVDPLEEGDTTIPCPNCGETVELDVGQDVRRGGPIQRCAVCGSDEMFRRKDFPQGLGLTLLAVAAVGSLVTYGFGYVLWALGILVATIGIDLGLYYLLPRMTGCYKCGAQYRGAALNPEHGEYDLAIADKYGRAR
jgi:predicted RNA-binding Zn-ribbon protein involved in translation (DUF1610 family)